MKASIWVVELEVAPDEWQPLNASLSLPDAKEAREECRGEGRVRIREYVRRPAKGKALR